MEKSHLGSMPRFTSPLGYRVVQIAEERVPPRPVRPIRPLISKPPVPSTSADWWVPVLAVGIFTIVIGFVVLLAASSTSVAPRTVAERPAEVFFDVPWEPVLQTAHIPAALATRPDGGEEKAEPAESAGLDAVADENGRETFGTTVEFVRNPVEARRIAKAERKLAFHLHVSGNFEDEAFT